MAEHGQEWPWLPPPPGTERPDVGEPLSESLRRRLLDQRVVLLHGPLDDVAVTRVSAELMTLDADGDGPVTLRVDCGEAGLAPALTLMDVIELLGVPVRALCLGQVAAGAVGVVAVCAQRSAMPSTRFSLCEPTTRHEAHVRNVAQWAELQARSGAASASAWAPPSASPSTPSRRTCSGDASSARPRRSRTASSTRCAGPTPPCATCRVRARRRSASGRCADLRRRREFMRRKSSPGTMNRLVYSFRRESPPARTKSGG